MSETILELKNICKKFHKGGILGGKDFIAVNNVSFKLKKGEIYSLIGESGSGKSTLGKMILQLLKPTSGEILFQNKKIKDFDGNKKEYYRNVQAVFQEPFSSFNPLYKVDRVFEMVLACFFPVLTTSQKNHLIAQSLRDVNLDPDTILGKYPHQLSGGQLQRILIARALLLQAKVIVADELISMLDASTRISVLNLLGKLAKEKGLAVIFITHDLSLGYYISDTSMIMYKGRIIEMGETTKVYHQATHPYTKLLLRSVPDVGTKWDRTEVFNPDMIEKEIQAFYQANRQKERDLQLIDKEHYAVLTG